VKESLLAILPDRAAATGKELRRRPASAAFEYELRFDAERTALLGNPMTARNGARRLAAIVRVANDP